MYIIRKILNSRLVSGSVVVILSCATAAVLIGLLMVDTVLLKKLDVDDPDALVRIKIPSPTGGISNPVFKELQRSADSFDELFHYMALNQFGIGVDGNDIILDGASVSGTYFESLGLVPTAGRLLQEADGGEGSSPVIVIGHSFWIRELAGDKDLMGQTIQMDGAPFTLVGVAPEGFNGLDPLSREDFWIPSEHIIDKWQLTNRSYPLFHSLGRLTDGYSRDAAQQELNQIGEAIRREFPNDGPNWIVTLLSQDEWVRSGGGARTINTILLIFGLVLALLVIALSNLMALVATRTESRKVEYATQLAVGARRGQIVKAYLLENFVLCLLGFGIGFVLAWAAQAYFVAELLDGVLVLNFGDLFRTDLLIFLILMPIAYGVVLSVGGLGTIYRLKPAVELRSGGKASRSYGGRKLLIFVQVALAIVVVSACSWFVESLKNVERHDFGFESERLVLVSTNLKLRGPKFSYAGNAITEYRKLKEWMETVPNVETVGLGTHLPLRHVGICKVDVDGFDRRLEPDECIVRLVYVGPGYFKTMGVELLEGREPRFEEMNYPMTKVVVNEAFVDRYWPGQAVLGRAFRPWQGGPEVTVTGVCANFSQELGEEVKPQILVGFAQTSMVFHLKTSIPTESFLPTFRRLLQEKDPFVPVLETTSLQGSYRETFSAMHLSFYTAAVIAGLSVMIAASGLFALVRHFIESSQTEIGIRMALGAEPSNILKWILRECGVPVVFGCLAGTALVYLIFPYASGLLFEVNRLEPRLLLWVLGTLLAVALASLLGPAIRTAYSSPVACLGGRR
ncbi:ABC transporter permease [Pelagicoccus sp. SDUM812002]|uniref:ABC transporter permease n=1 Tax=Pelagicoccus sp. SDUM812002 TaxID=3041266 RepID=UPI0028109059|nr:ABC transporter permease [Pelagicoccus sp. SDUM812002]MDQ8185710.1 ABC transporter permease [Pelagicoccus sp. SDUM812002]